MSDHGGREAAWWEKRHPLADPGAFRWVPSGVTGLARPREWDATAIVEAPELEDTSTTTVSGRVFADAVVGDVAASLLAAVDTEVERPYELLAVRRTRERWAVAARRLHSELLDLPEGVAAAMLEVVVSPEAERSAFADGEQVTDWVGAALGEALAELERRGRDRFQAFVARADKLGDDRWELTVDPL